jgi:hypothetical protein
MINFPDSPTLNQIFAAAGSSWKWDGAKWVPDSSGGGTYEVCLHWTATAAIPGSPALGSWARRAR